jgi:CRISPR-associated protein Cmr3
MSTQHLFIEPSDVLFLRGNKLFGDPGSYGEALMPPWPSVAAGALRSWLLATDGTDLAAFAQCRVEHRELGTPAKPGSFRLLDFQLALRGEDGAVESMHRVPADLELSEGDSGALKVNASRPQALPAGIQSSARLPQLPILAAGDSRQKPVSGYWLKAAGWRQYLAGQVPTPEQFVRSADLWAVDERIGVGLDPALRRAEDGKLFGTQALVPKPGFGFLTRVAGAILPESGSLRFGGDGRAASVRRVDAVAMDTRPADLQQLLQQRRMRLVALSPCQCPGGWLPGDAAGQRIELHGVRGRIVAATVPRAEVVSGWDLAARGPKPAERMAPAGSVWWIDELEASAEALAALLDRGLWAHPAGSVIAREAEGFNRIAIAAWTQ